MRRTVLALLLLVTSSCGSIVGTVPFYAPGRGNTVVGLEAGRDVQFWANLAAHYERRDVKDLEDVTYEVELVQDGAVVANVQCRPRQSDFKRGCKSPFRGPHSYHHDDCELGSCVARVPKSGPTEVRATLTAPASVQIERANLIVEQ